MSTKMFFLATISALSVFQQAAARPLAWKRVNSTAAIGDFGSCTVPQIKFATGFDNRKETSFEPVDQVSYNHGSAQNIDIITQFMCDTLVNSCNADATAKATCATAKAAADTVTAKTGGQADAFNAVFGIITDFAAVAEISDQGSTIAPGASATIATAAIATAAATTTAAAVAADATDPCTATVTVTSTSSAVLAAATTESCAAVTVTQTVTVTAGGAAATTAASATTSAAAAATTTAAATSNDATTGANFGTCTTPQIKFADGLDGRKETAFEPADLTSFNHGSADNIAVITSFICGQVGSSCKGNQAAQTLCTTATAAAAAAAVGTGAQADAFNAVFGITTDFAAIAEISNTGATVAAGSGSAAANSAAAAASTSKAAIISSAVTSAAAASSTAAASGSNLQTFTGALGGVAAPAVTASGSQFQVAGNDLFNDVAAAVERSCSVQNNKCSDAANASGNANGFTVSACGAQETACNAA
ncbi:hypothetical protein HWV62_31341 [Athelia sp. TMB]|nr:hypothetical protein HWV62_31341 [Athelia sp. TMB]